jgi:hypothetical protein
MTMLFWRRPYNFNKTGRLSVPRMKFCTKCDVIILVPRDLTFSKTPRIIYLGIW